MSIVVSDPETLGKQLPNGCAICGGRRFEYGPVLWQSLIDEWQLSPDEALYTNLQQGLRCADCSGNLRSMVLARAICAAFAFDGALTAWVQSDGPRNATVLEINEAGTLTPHLANLKGHCLVRYPEYDMHNLPFEGDNFDLVVHSDTLEHVPNPVHALAECRRILRPHGVLAYTVPVIVGRMTRSREGLPGSYHGSPGDQLSDFLVHTEFGADFWASAIRAGFEAVTVHSWLYPASLALTARK